MLYINKFCYGSGFRLSSSFLFNTSTHLYLEQFIAKDDDKVLGFDASRHLLREEALRRVDSKRVQDREQERERGQQKRVREVEREREREHEHE